MSEGDLKLGYEMLGKASRQATVFNNYYEGKQPLIYTHERLADVFGGHRKFVNFTQNWCCVVVDAVLDRLIFKGWDTITDETNSLLDEWYKQFKLQDISRKVHKDFLVTGDGYVMFDMVDGVAQPFYNESKLIYVEYESDNPNVKRFGVKRWFDAATNQNRLNLYYPDRIEKYAAQKATSWKAFKLESEEVNPFGKIPIVHFEAESLELINVLPLQDAINKIFSDMMVAGEFGAFPQRWAITNADIDSLTSDPASIMSFPKSTTDEEGTQVGQFESANLDMYLNAMDKLANVIAVITRTPKHYFMNTGANIAGEALLVMESPLVKKCDQYVENLSNDWLEVAGYVTPETDITTVWGKRESDLFETNAKVMDTLKRVGIPLITIVRRLGWGQDEIDQMLLDMAEEKQAQAEMAQQALEIAKIRLQAENNVNTGQDQTR